MPFVAVDCDREANRPLCGRYGVQVGRCCRRRHRHWPVPGGRCGLRLHSQLFFPFVFCPQGFPTIKLFTPGSASPTDYQGPRTAKALADAAVGALHMAVWG